MKLLKLITINWRRRINDLLLFSIKTHREFASISFERSFFFSLTLNNFRRWKHFSMTLFSLYLSILLFSFIFVFFVEFSIASSQFWNELWRLLNFSTFPPILSRSFFFFNTKISFLHKIFFIKTQNNNYSSLIAVSNSHEPLNSLNLFYNKSRFEPRFFAAVFRYWHNAIWCKTVIVTEKSVLKLRFEIMNWYFIPVE